MYRILLVDDEREILDWLFELFQDAEDMELDVYKAISGKEALEILGKIKIDVVVSDIKMPGLNGLQLLEKIKSRWTSCRVVFLSGYNDFDYVYTAIKYEGVSYMLKTESDEKILEEVQKAITNLEESMKKEELVQKAEKYMQESLPYMQMSFLRRIFLAQEPVEQITQKVLSELKLPLIQNHPVLLVAGKFDKLPKEATPSVAIQMATRVKIRADEIFGGNFKYSCLLREGIADFVWILQPKSMDDNIGKKINYDMEAFLSGLLETIQDFCRISLKLKASFSYCIDYVPWENIGDNYANIILMLSASAGMGGESIINEKIFSGITKQAVIIEPVIGKKLIFALNSLPAILEKGEKDLYLQVYQEVADYLSNTKGKNNINSQELYYRIATMLLTVINRNKIADKISAKINIESLTRADMHGGWNNAATYLSDVSIAIFDLLKTSQKNYIQETVRKIQTYIQEHLEENLSLVKLAEISFFNPSYLSRFFKQATGQSVTEYIFELRIRRAKELLQDPNNKINDVSKMLGYESQNYFSRFFKKHTGFTPQEFRTNIYKK